MTDKWSMIPTLRIVGRFGFYFESPDLKCLHCLFALPPRCHDKSFKVDQIPGMTCVYWTRSHTHKTQTCLLRIRRKLSQLLGNHCGNLTRWGWDRGTRSSGCQLCVIAARPAAPGVRWARPLNRAARGRPGPAPALRQQHRQHGRPEPEKHPDIKGSCGPRMHTGVCVCSRARAWGWGLKTIRSVTCTLTLKLRVIHLFLCFCLSYEEPNMSPTPEVFDLSLLLFS